MNEIRSWFQQIAESIRRDPLSAVLVATVIATLVYFFGVLHLFTNGRLSMWTWAWQAWNPETNYEHAKFIPLIVAFLIWYNRDKLKNAPIGSSRWGWWSCSLASSGLAHSSASAPRC